MENTQAHPLIKKTRRLPRVWKRFFALKAGEQFHSPTGALRAKTGPFWSHSVALGILYFVPPWRRVRTTVYVRDVLPGGKHSQDLLPPGKPVFHVKPESQIHYPERVLGVAIPAEAFGDRPGSAARSILRAGEPFPAGMGETILQPTDDNRTGPSA